MSITITLLFDKYLESKDLFTQQELKSERDGIEIDLTYDILKFSKIADQIDFIYVDITRIETETNTVYIEGKLDGHVMEIIVSYNSLELFIFCSKRYSHAFQSLFQIAAPYSLLCDYVCKGYFSSAEYMDYLYDIISINWNSEDNCFEQFIKYIDYSKINNFSRRILIGASLSPSNSWRCLQFMYNCIRNNNYKILKHFLSKLVEDIISDPSNKVCLRLELILMNAIVLSKLDFADMIVEFCTQLKPYQIDDRNRDIDHYELYAWRKYELTEESLEYIKSVKDRIDFGIVISNGKVIDLISHVIATFKEQNYDKQYKYLSTIFPDKVV